MIQIITIKRDSRAWRVLQDAMKRDGDLHLTLDGGLKIKAGESMWTTPLEVDVKDVTIPTSAREDMNRHGFADA